MTTINLIIILVFCTIWVLIIASSLIEMVRLRSSNETPSELEENLEGHLEEPMVESELESELEELEHTDDATVLKLASKKWADDMTEQKERIRRNVLLKGYYSRIDNIINRARVRRNYEGYQEDIQTLKEFISDK